MNSVKCICCNKEVNRLYTNLVDEKKPWIGMWGGGIVDRIDAGYGSLLDGDMFVIAVCDTCIDEKTKEGIAQWSGNYMVKLDNYIGLNDNK